MKLKGIRGLLKGIETEEKKISQKTSNETNDNRPISGRKSNNKNTSSSSPISSSSQPNQKAVPPTPSKKSRSSESIEFTSNGPRTRMSSSTPNKANLPNTRNAPRAPRKIVIPDSITSIASVAAPAKRKRRTKAEMEEFRKQEALKPVPVKAQKHRVLGEKKRKTLEDKLKDKTVKDSEVIPDILFDKNVIAELFEHGDKISIPSPTFDNPQYRFEHRKTVIFDRVDNTVVYVLYDIGNGQIRSIPMKFGIYDYRS